MKWQAELKVAAVKDKDIGSFIEVLVSEASLFDMELQIGASAVLRLTQS